MQEQHTCVAEGGETKEEPAPKQAKELNSNFDEEEDDDAPLLVVPLQQLQVTGVCQCKGCNASG